MDVIDIAMTSWPNHPKRIEYISIVLESLKANLSASGHELKLYCSIETQRDPKVTWHGDELAALLQQYGATYAWRDDTANLGANMNAAIRMGSGRFVLVNQDDWALRYPLDISPGAELLDRYHDLDIVRYCWPDSDNMRPTYCGDLDGWRLIDPKGRWPYGDDPHLRRRDFTDTWGWYMEGGGHGSASGALMEKMARLKAKSVVADRVYYAHKGRVSAVLGDVRSGANRRYEE
jgi:hypothetical protein